jgi:GT2 family glycosyltransferase
VTTGPEPPAAPALSISIVVYRPEPETLRSTLHSLPLALEHARSAGVIGEATVVVVDNGSVDEPSLDALVAETLGRSDWLGWSLMRGQGNVGYGRGHNLAIERAAAPYHLVLNPDVVLDPPAIAEAVRYLEGHAECGLVTPRVVNGAGDREYLCKRYPSVLVLALRGFAPAWLRRPFRHRLEWYEMRDLPGAALTTGIPIATGCFMLVRGDMLRRLGGFSPDFFLYFEDFDLSLRLRRLADIAYVPQVRIVHVGGYASAKGWAHRRMFIRSAATFFRRHGWKFW